MTGALSKALTEVATAVAQVENLEAKLTSRDAELRDCWMRLERWEPESCRRGRCEVKVPTKAIAETMRAQGFEPTLAQGLAWSLGFCSESCAEMEQASPSVTPGERKAARLELVRLMDEGVQP